MANLSKNQHTGYDQIGADDLRAVTRLLGGLAVESGDLDRKRRLLIGGLAEMVDADGWLWVVGGVDSARQLPMQMGMLSGGLSDQQVAGLMNSPSDTGSASPLDQPLAALVAEGKHFVRTRQQLAGDDAWYGNANTQTYLLRHGIDQCMYAITPLGGNGFSGIGFFRRTDRAPFSERQRRIVHIVTTEVRWLGDTSIPAERETDIAQLTPRLRSVLSLLLDGYLCNQIAELYHLSPHTVKGYIRDIYRHFDVSSQLALIRRFRGKEIPSD